MDAKDWVALVGITATATMAVVTLFVNRRREQLQQERDDRLRKEQQAREERLLEEQRKREAERQALERTYQPRIEFGIDCIFHGLHHDSHIVEFQLITQNKGNVQHRFEKMILRVRGIDSEQPLTYLQGYEKRLNFPVKLLDNVSVIPQGYGYFFVEPGAKQTIAYITKIPSSLKYILAHAVFWYDENTNHVTEKVFPVIVR
jgi:hypothetical protein